jgi:hypothetical protein
MKKQELQDRKITVGTSLKYSEVAVLEQFAKKKNTTISAIVRDAVREYVKIYQDILHSTASPTPFWMPSPE